MSVRAVVVTLALLAVTGVASSCVLPTPQPSPCRAGCRADHDRCVVDAMDGASLQACDQELSACLEHCAY